MALTRRQREIYDHICEFVKAQGYSPSLEEIGAHFGLASVATVHKHVQHLVEKGFLRKSWNRSRSVEPVPEKDVTPGFVTLDLAGAVAAGAPIESYDLGEQVDVPADMVRRPGESFVLRVRGESMIDEQIRDGDLVVVESRPDARNGDTVVALVGGSEATLKKFYRKGDDVSLVPANADMEPMEFHASKVQICGVLRGLLRSY